MRIGIDIGGTFTDLIASDDGSITVVKVPSTPSDPSIAFADALARVQGSADEVRHGTTVATNAVLTRTGADIGFVTTQGFRHLLQLARQDRPSLYDVRVRRPDALVPPHRCVGIPERLGPHGEVIAGLDENAAREALERLRGVDGVAITLLHSYADASHEQRVADLAREVLGDVSISVSSDVLPEFREYERASTTTLNAYVQPVVSSYLGRVRSAATTNVGVMWSGGAVRSIEHTIRSPINTMFSGPAAGVLGAAWAARACGSDDVITIDMGGTSADVATIDGGRAAIAEESSIDGLPFRTPSLDVISVGAGGGSIAWVDEGGALRVGPASAGADPGPACYGRGGTDATVTDAQVVLGYLGGHDLAGGELTLDVDAAIAAVDRVADRAGLERDEAAEGVLRVVRATMSRAIRSVTVERGKDARRYALVAFGGAGPLHGTALARELGITTVIVPPFPGALAALGLLVATRRAEASRSRPVVAEAANDGVLLALVGELSEKVVAELRDEGVAADSTSTFVDCRYEGQSHELRIEVRSPRFAAVAAAFHDAHRARYGFDRRDVAVEAVTFRVSASGPEVPLPFSAPVDREPSQTETRRIAGVEARIYERATLPADLVIDGPAVITELDSTTWIDEASSAVVHPSGSLIVTLR
jgi:N-methylhydantoinase A